MSCLNHTCGLGGVCVVHDTRYDQPAAYIDLLCSFRHHTWFHGSLSALFTRQSLPLDPILVFCRWWSPEDIRRSAGRVGAGAGRAVRDVGDAARLEHPSSHQGEGTAERKRCTERGVMPQRPVCHAHITHLLLVSLPRFSPLSCGALAAQDAVACSVDTLRFRADKAIRALQTNKYAAAAPLLTHHPVASPPWGERIGFYKWCRAALSYSIF